MGLGRLQNIRLREKIMRKLHELYHDVSAACKEIFKGQNIFKISFSFNYFSDHVLFVLFAVECRQMLLCFQEVVFVAIKHNNYFWFH